MDKRSGAPSAAQLARFEAQLPAWVAGLLPTQEGLWMVQLLQTYPQLSPEVQVLRDARSAVRAAAATENTDAAWQLLQQRMAPSTPRVPKPEPLPPAASPAGWSRWWRAWVSLWEAPRWGNALASLALALVIGPTGWLVWQQVEAPQRDAAGTAWRAVDVDELAAAPLPSIVLAVQWRDGTTAAALAAVLPDLDADPQARVLWQPLGAQRWQLQVHGSLHDVGWWQQRLQTLPQVLQVQPLELASPAAGTPFAPSLP